SDLWSSIADASGKDINEMMHGWVYQPGYPLITVDASDPSKFIAAQERFFLLKRSNESSAAFGTLWQIPLAYRGLKSGDGDKPAIARTMFDSKQSSIKAAVEEPLVVNAGGDGYYRVRYSPALLHSFEDDLQKNLTPAERISLLSDQFSLAFTGMIPLKDYLALTAKYKDETDANVISLLITEMHSLYEVIDAKDRPAFQAFVRDRLEPAKQRLGWTVADNEDVLTTLARQEVMSAMGTIGQDKDTIAQARELFKKYLADKSAVNKDLIPPILNTVAYNGNEQSYKQITALWQAARTPELEKRSLMSLGLFRPPVLIEKTLAMALTDQVRTQDAPNLIGEVTSTVDGRKMGWQFTQAHWHLISERFAPHMVPRIIGAASALNTNDEAEQLKSFFKSNPTPFGTRTIAKTIEEIEANAAFRQRSGEALSSWLASNTDAAPEKTKSSMK
ncbi:MAG: ERAP1-like C-terminal domain-containing protein, partial [Terriglobales bacterium]